MNILLSFWEYRTYTHTHTPIQFYPISYSTYDIAANATTIAVYLLTSTRLFFLFFVVVIASSAAAVIVWRQLFFFFYCSSPVLIVLLSSIHFLLVPHEICLCFGSVKHIYSQVQWHTLTHSLTEST